MKMPDSWKEELNNYKTPTMNTMALIGVSFLWAHFLDLISIWWMPLTVLTLMAAYGHEISKRK